MIYKQSAAGGCGWILRFLGGQHLDNDVGRVASIKIRFGFATGTPDDWYSITTVKLTIVQIPGGAVL
ncbi:hypothetical protein [Thiocapsa sp.]|uniref:hypothetical protein n=1 Tax=Thiocapsa sp. TaxID=2024551 RepID=UPI002BDE0E4D|nr:hypothetical protein [Thiocapsa sp.]HSO81993.1 hypothetical protein [Thiocapsa sp.]